MTLHNYLQKRARLLKGMRDASTNYLWHCNDRTSRGKRSATIWARKLKELSADLYRLQAASFEWTHTWSDGIGGRFKAGKVKR